MPDCIRTTAGSYFATPYENEADLETSISEIQDQLFGTQRIYLDTKKKIGIKGGIRNIPDGYLIDLTGPQPRLFVVENELAAHDPLRHIAVQILQFSLSFESEQIGVKRILLAALDERPKAKDQCQQYAAETDYRNLDHLLEWLVFESPFSALVIIDEIPDNLENILAKKFKFGVEVLCVSRYQNAAGERLHRFEPFLSDLELDPPLQADRLLDRILAPPDQASPFDIDTIVVPAREEGFNEVFLGEQRWRAVRIHGSMRPQLKFIAAYQVAPVQAITYAAPIHSIEPWKDTGKFELTFADPAKPIGPIKMLLKGRVRNFQSSRYTTWKKLAQAQSLDDLW